MKYLLVRPILWFVLLSISSGTSQEQCKQRKVLPRFTDYPAETYRGKMHAPVFKRRHDRMFQTAIREAWRDGINYGGHYVVANWGCGSGCSQFAVIDAITGVIYDPPFQEVDFHYWLGLAKDPKWANYDPKWLCYDDRLTYQPDSGLLVVEGCVNEYQCGRTFFKMNAQGLRQVAFDPDLLPDGTVAPP